MCGLFTYLNYNVNRERTDILQVLFNGLRRLEYRGYDSTGIAIDNSTSDPFTSSSTCSSQPLLNSLPHSPPPLVFRQEGNIESLVESVYQDLVPDGIVSILKFDNDKGRHDAALSRASSVQHALSILDMGHYMQKEIHEQPESLTTTMRGRLICGGSCKAKGVLFGGLKDHLKTIRRSRGIVFVDCGTSYNSALAARPIVEELSGVPVTLEIASDLLDRQGHIYRDYTAVFGSAIARHTHCGVHINAYTSQIVVMPMLALAFAGDAISSQPRRQAIIDGLFDLPNKIREVLKLDHEMKDLAKLLMPEQSLLVFGRGYNYATALEGALKVKEVALMHSEGMLAGEMKHGPLALVDENLPIIQSVIQQLHARKGRLIVMCSKGDTASVCPGESCLVIEVPQVEDCLEPVANIVPLQLLAYDLTVLRGYYNVDQPRNHAKSVTTH
uniref:glutamine--fructose-6-phosphate transaminase (isomerizing) n=1 Tax=Manihot esculenta TaxID=3983 RepID=A0A2C9UNN6_MANES